jgi:hypothetical protein
MKERMNVKRSQDMVVQWLDLKIALPPYDRRENDFKIVIHHLL